MKEISANISSIRPGSLEKGRQPNARTGVDDSGFADQLAALQSPGLAGTESAPLPSLKFSNHAIDRMQARGIHFTPNEMARIENAVAKAQAKGAKNSLLLMDDSALIVSVKDKTVVTVMDKTSLKDNVFTNIDSTVMI